MRRQFVFLHTDETIAFFRNDYTEAKDHQQELYIEATFPLDDEKPIENGMYVAYRDRDGNDLLFIIERPVVDLVEREVSFTASLAAMVELGDENIIEDRRPANCQAGFAVSVALEDTRWKLGTAEATGIASNSFYYINPWAALQSISEKYPCFFRFRVTITDEGITGRYVDVLADIGRDIGLRLELYKNLDELTYDINESTVRTALYGRGKGEEVGTNSSGDATYGRRLTLADLEWSKAKGDPCDKPLGQEWIEDVEATALYGRNGRKRIDVVTFEECEDINELGRLTWEKLQSIKEPRVTVKAAVRYLEGTYGYDGEVARYGDYVTVIISNTAHVRARVTAAVIDLVDDQATQLTIGNSVLSIIDLYSQNAQDLESAKEKLSIAGGIAAKNPELFKGILNTMVTRILSTGTRMYTDEKDGSFVWEADDGNSAVKITGNGILISSEKIGDEFVWTTALDGYGITASVVNSGVINASLVKILGTDRFYWDSQNIYIFDTENTKNQIRIGLYDGEHYGIAYSQDDGVTWQSAIGFNGVVLGAGSVTKESLSDDVAGTLNDISQSISEHNSQFTLLDNKIAAKVSQTDYVADMSGKANVSDVEAQFNAAAELTAKNLSLKFTESKNYTDEKTSGFDNFASSMMTYFEFAVTGMLIGMKDSPFKVNISNEKVSFTQNGEEVAFIQYNRMHITEARVTDRLSIGTEDNGYFDWVTTNDGLGLKWR